MFYQNMEATRKRPIVARGSSRKLAPPCRAHDLLAWGLFPGQSAAWRTPSGPAPREPFVPILIALPAPPPPPHVLDPSSTAPPPPPLPHPNPYHPFSPPAIISPKQSLLYLNVSLFFLTSPNVFFFFDIFFCIPYLSIVLPPPCVI